jgi:hypothetical protein
MENSPSESSDCNSKDYSATEQITENEPENITAVK